MGIEPTSEAWEASILPLYDARPVLPDYTRAGNSQYSPAYAEFQERNPFQNNSLRSCPPDSAGVLCGHRFEIQRHCRSHSAAELAQWPKERMLHHQPAPPNRPQGICHREISR